MNKPRQPPDPRTRGWWSFITVLAALSITPVASATGPRSAAERAFLTDMVAHHTMAVEMAKMAQEKATHQELKDAAAKIVTSQSAESTACSRG